MRILAVTPYYEPEGGGLERYAHAILKRLVQHGHDVQAACFTRGEPGRSDQDGVDVIRFAPTGIIGNTPVAPRFATKLRRLVQAARPDVILAHTPVPFSALAAARVARREGIPLVVTYHAGQLRGSGPVLDIAARFLRRFVEPRMLRQSARLIAVSPYVRDHALAAYQDKVQVIPPGVDASTHPPGTVAEPPEILFVGPLDRAYRWKGLDVLVHAIGQLGADHPDLRLLLVGDGDRRGELEAHGDPIRVLGRLPASDLAAAYARATAVVLPSTTDAEAFGMVLAEANAAGRPVIGSRIGGIPDFIEHGHNGLLVPPGDAAELADAIRRLLDDPPAASAMGQRGHDKVVALHDWDDLAEATAAQLDIAATTMPATRRPPAATPSGSSP